MSAISKMPSSSSMSKVLRTESLMSSAVSAFRVIATKRVANFSTSSGLRFFNAFPSLSTYASSLA